MLRSFPSKQPLTVGEAHSFAHLKTLGVVAFIFLSNTLLNDALNLKLADLTSQLRGGKTLADIGKAQHVDQAKVKQAIIDAD